MRLKIATRRLLRIIGRIPGAKRFYFKVVQKPFYELATQILAFNGYRRDYGPWGVFSQTMERFIKDPVFLKGYEIANQHNEGHPLGYHKVHTAQWAASNAVKLDGDFVECGVWYGASVLCNIVLLDFDKLDKKYYLFDTFEGLDKRFYSKRNRGLGDKFKNKYTKDIFPEVSDTFSKYPNVELIKGTIPETLNNVKIDKIAYLYVDMNSATPELEALKFFWPRMVKGGIIILDDYACPQHGEQGDMMDAFARSVGVKILSLPSGQGMMIK